MADETGLFSVSAEDDKTTFWEAMHKCYTQQMELASVLSDEEQNEMTKILVGVYSKQNETEVFWLGGTSLLFPNTNKYYWFPSGVEIETPQKPDSHVACLQMVYHPSRSGWKKANCFSTKRYICKSASQSRSAPVTATKYQNFLDVDAHDDFPIGVWISNTLDRILVKTEHALDWLADTVVRPFQWLFGRSVYDDDSTAVAHKVTKPLKEKPREKLLPPKPKSKTRGKGRPIPGTAAVARSGLASLEEKDNPQSPSTTPAPVTLKEATKATLRSNGEEKTERTIKKTKSKPVSGLTSKFKDISVEATTFTPAS